MPDVPKEQEAQMSEAWQDNPAFKRGNLDAARSAPFSGHIKRKRVLDGIRTVLIGEGVRPVDIEKSQIHIPGWGTATASSPSAGIQRYGLDYFNRKAAGELPNRPYVVFGVPRGAKNADDAYAIVPIEVFARLLAASQRETN